MSEDIRIGGLSIKAPVTEAYDRILTDEALQFVGALARKFEPARQRLLKRREEVQQKIDRGALPDFPEETRHIREAQWQIGAIPVDLQDRRVEITGPVDRKMIINALNSGASTFMADFEDSHAPTWTGTMNGQLNLSDAVNGTIDFTSPDGSKQYRLKDNPATLIVRPRGWHLTDKHIEVDGLPISGSILDFGLYFFHNAQILINMGTGPYFYLPKLENHLEARLWNDVFLAAQELLNIPKGTIKATVLIETILAAFETEEILYELKDHIVGLNCGRWDYIFSFIKKFKNVPGYLFPDRAQITMTSHCMHAYSLLVIQTCHKRGAMAIGGMAAQIPIKTDPAENRAAFEKVKTDKTREAEDGHDGTWVAHPGLVSLARDEFDRVMPTPNQIHKQRADVHVSAADLLRLPEGTITEAGLRTNISVGVQYMTHWLNGNGCVPLYNLMEDAATAEISRTQVWQWVHHQHGQLSDGRKVTLELVRTIMAEELDNIRESVGDDQYEKYNYPLAARLFEEIVAADALSEFLTLRVYEYL
ncbi:MAG: malate synthase A [Desulfobacteraceae bacterium]|nr:malate synthase A [Desulfobacteraceae bacterium]